MSKILKNIAQLFLFVIAWLLVPAFTVVNWLTVALSHKSVNGYFRSTAYSLDCWANREFRAFLNAVMLTKKSQHHFGNIQESMSSVFGKNKVENTLSLFGRMIVKMLDWFDDNHCENAIHYDVISSGIKFEKDGII